MAARFNFPYVSFSALKAFIWNLASENGLTEFNAGLRRDHARSTAFQLRHALRALDLADGDYAPTPRLRMIVAAIGTQTQRVAFAQVMDAYDRSLGALPLHEMGPSDLDVAFSHAGCTHGVSEKAKRLYLALAVESGRTVGERLRHGRMFGEVTKARRSSRRFSAPPASYDYALSLTQLRRELTQLLPPFNPMWDQTVQLAWHRSFQRLAADTNALPNHVDRFKAEG
jgi:hypothetical protein